MSAPIPDPVTLNVISQAPTFTQTGSWNMVDLSAAPIKGTLSALSRYSAARVNPYVATMGQIICSKFQLSVHGRHNIDDAVQKLKVVGTLGKTLEIGFAIEDIVRMMAKTDEGRLCIAFCSSLIECYSEDMAVQILVEMAALVEVNGDYKPASQSWKELLSACAGTLAATKFPVLAEHFMQLTKTQKALGVYHGYDSSPDIVRSCSNPKDIAKALNRLAALTRGDIRSTILVGGNDIGWLAAIAQWLFDLKLVIYEENRTDITRSSILYTNCENSDDAQLQLYVRGGRVNHKSSGWELEVMGQGTVLSDVAALFKEQGLPYESAVVSGRIVWEKALDTTFGGEFRKLMRLGATVGTAIGSAARLFNGLASAAEVFPNFSRAACSTYCTASAGRGFVSNTLFWFKELEPAKTQMEKAASLGITQARENYDSSIEILRSTCGCATCESPTTGHVITPADTANEGADHVMTPVPNEDLDEEPDDESFATDRDVDIFCLVILVETIITASRLLSNVLLENKALLPMTSGLQLAYGRQSDHRICAPLGMDLLREVGQIAFCLDFDRNLSFCELVGGESAVDFRMQHVLSIFSGRSVSTSSGMYGAICSNGITAFLGVLRGTTTHRDAVSRIQLIPGKIIYSGKSYETLVDRSNVFPCAKDLWQAVQRMEPLDQVVSPELVVQEKYMKLECVLELGPLVRVGPAALVAQLAGQTGLITCPSRGQQTVHGMKMLKPKQRLCTPSVLFTSMEIQTAIMQRTPLAHGGKQIFILDCETLEDAIPSIGLTTHLTAQSTVYFVHSECNSCCIRTALSVNRPERPSFCFFRLPR
jgi:hypothetical protein